MNGQVVVTIWEFISLLLFFGISLLGFASIITLAVWKAKELYVIININERAKRARV